MYTADHHGMMLYALVGVYEWEREALRPLVFGLHLEHEKPLELSRNSIEQQLVVWLKPCRYRLLEALAEYLAERIMSAWQCSKVVISIEKPGALGDLARVGVRIQRDETSNADSREPVSCRA